MALRVGEIELVQEAFAAGERNWSQRLPAVQPIVGQGKVSTDGVFVRIRDEDRKEVKVSTFSQVTLSVCPEDQVTEHHPAHEPLVALSQHSHQATLDDADHMAGWQLAEGVRRIVFACSTLSSTNDAAA